MAPEVMCRQNHGVSADFYGLGVILYELMLKKLPYLGKNRTEIREKIMDQQIQIKKHEIPVGWSLESADFINRLIQRKPTNRIGFNGALELKNHSWLKNYPWEKLKSKILTYQDKIKLSKVDSRYFKELATKTKVQNSYEAQIEAEFIEEKRFQLEKDSIQNMFSGYQIEERGFREEASTFENTGFMRDQHGMNEDWETTQNKLEEKLDLFFLD